MLPFTCKNICQIGARSTITGLTDKVFTVESEGEKNIGGLISEDRSNCRSAAESTVQNPLLV